MSSRPQQRTPGSALQPGAGRPPSPSSMYSAEQRPNRNSTVAAEHGDDNNFVVTPLSDHFDTPLQSPPPIDHTTYASYVAAAGSVRDDDDGDATPRAAQSTTSLVTTTTTNTQTFGGDALPADKDDIPKVPELPDLTQFAPIRSQTDRANRLSQVPEASSKRSSWISTRRNSRRLSNPNGMSNSHRWSVLSDGRIVDEDDLFRALSRRRTGEGAEEEDPSTQAEIDKLIGRMFGQGRQHSEEGKVNHAGVVFRNLTVKGLGLGAAIQPTVGGLFLAPFRAIGSLFGGRQKAAPRTLIDDFTGCIKPGEMLLVLGRPGSGCSTFLKVLANQRFGFEAVDGDVAYGGTSAKTMAKDYRGEILYNPEDDLHYATLSVRNTLNFALKSKAPAKEALNDGESKSDYMTEFLRVVTKLFWIEHTLDTKVGDEHLRGVSGGERKRVSIAEAMITRASVQCWDNSTKGLDASTALEYVSSLRALTNAAQISTSVALYQAGESLWKAFDKVILIDEGKCLYYGSTDDAVQYFEGLGFERPSTWTSADYLTSVTDPHERKVKPGWENRIPRSAEQFAQAFRESHVAKKNVQDIGGFERDLEEQRRERLAVKAKKQNFTLPFYEQVIACTWRQFLVMFGNKQALIAKYGGVIFQSLIIGSLFYDQPQTSAGVFTRGGILFFMLLFNALLALAELTATFASRPILLKHKSFSFYRPSAFAIAQSVVDIPLVIIQVTLFDIVIYFLSGLSRTPSQFFISWIFLIFITLTMYGFFRSIGSWAGSLDAATRVTGVAIQALVLYTGYLIPPKSMHPWFSWIRYINPVAYGFEGLIVNEFHNLNLECVEPDIVPFNGQAPHVSCLTQGSMPGTTVVNGDNYVQTAFDYSHKHLWRNFGIVIAFYVFFSVLTAIGMEIQKPNKGGAAVTVFKRGQAPKSVEAAMSKNEVPDEENTIAPAGGLGTIVEQDSETGSSLEKAKSLASNTSTFSWQNITYTVDTKQGPKTLLRDVTGFVRPGKLTALMGSSGAGKTTLLNTLAQRINSGVVTGDFLVDGRPLPKSFQRATGYAEQMDLHEPTSTVREALRFSALLRQPRETPVAEKYEYCERIIDLLEMRDIAGATIGRVGEGLNAEQRKRLTIGVELASKPELLLFLDEPTSGLDSGAAFNIVRFLRKLADAGQAILCTIHQPSSVLMSNFDELLLLKAGGRVVYNGELGEHSKTMLTYFERHGAKPCPAGTNPAEYMLEAIGAGDPTYKGQDWADTWLGSDERAARHSEIEQMIQDRSQAAGSSGSAVVDEREFAMPYWAQVKAVVKRSFTSYWRSPEYIIGKFALHILAGLFNSFTFYKPGYTSTDMQNRMFSVFITFTIAPPLIQQLQPRFLAARQLYASRERNSKIYGWVPFVLGTILPEIPYSLLAGTIYYMTWWWGGVGWKIGSSVRSVYVWLMILVFELFYVSFGQAIAAFSPNDLLASLLVPLLFLFVVAFCGVIAPPMAMPYFWRVWLYPLTPFRYLAEGIISAVVHDIPVRCAPSEFAVFSAPPGVSCENYTAGMPTGYVQTNAQGMCEYCQFKNGDEFAAGKNLFYDHHWRDYGIFWGYLVFNFAVVFLASWLYLVGGKKIKAALGGGNKKKTGGVSTGAVGAGAGVAPEAEKSSEHGSSSETSRSGEKPVDGNYGGQGVLMPQERPGTAL